MKRFFKRFGFDFVYGFSLIVLGAITVVLFPDDWSVIHDLMESDSISLFGFGICVMGIGYIVPTLCDAISFLFGSRKEDLEDG